MQNQKVTFRDRDGLAAGLRVFVTGFTAKTVNQFQTSGCTNR
jgi:hypothetical protein